MIVIAAVDAVTSREDDLAMLKGFNEKPLRNYIRLSVCTSLSFVSSPEPSVDQQRIVVVLWFHIPRGVCGTEAADNNGDNTCCVMC